MTSPQIPNPGEALSQEQISFLETFCKSCRKSLVQMVTNAQSGHPGGSLSSLDYLATLYTYILSQTGEKIVVSHGHISPAVYSVLGELDYIDKEDVVTNFRKINTPYEGHVTRHVPGIFYGTGPLGVGVSAAAGFALAEKLKDTGEKVYSLMGDGEVQEGQVFEMINFAAHNNLDNLILFVDYNKVQLTASLEEIQNIDIPGIFKAGKWHVIEVDGHDYAKMWDAISQAQNNKDYPTVIVGNTIMGKGVELMEADGQSNIPTWHGKAPKPEDIEESIKKLETTEEEKAQIQSFKEKIKWRPSEPEFPAQLSPIPLDTGEPILYEAGEIADCRNAYGKALADIGVRNKNIVGLTADLKSSVMTKYLDAENTGRHIECGIAEQNMVTVAGALSLSDGIPFASTFGAFLTSRVKDQARVNDINQCNVKLVATHCGLSVGEDGPTHQAIDDAGTYLGFFNTMLAEPADANQTDRIIRYIASHFGNFYVRMGRHKFPIITKTDGTPFYDKDYIYEYGKSDVLREGSDLTIVAIGSMVNEALVARENLAKTAPNLSVEIVAATSIKKFDQTLISSIKKTKKVMTVEDHNTHSGIGGQLARHLLKEGVEVKEYKMLGVEEYQLSGKSPELYQKAGISAEGIEKSCLEMLR